MLVSASASRNAPARNNALLRFVRAPRCKPRDRSTHTHAQKRPTTCTVKDVQRRRAGRPYPRPESTRTQAVSEHAPVPRREFDRSESAPPTVQSLAWPIEYMVVERSPRPPPSVLDGGGSGRPLFTHHASSAPHTPREAQAGIALVNSTRCLVANRCTTVCAAAACNGPRHVQS